MYTSSLMSPEQAIRIKILFVNLKNSLMASLKHHDTLMVSIVNKP